MNDPDRGVMPSFTTTLNLIETTDAKANSSPIPTTAPTESARKWS
jgi:hypothetical protein